MSQQPRMDRATYKKQKEIEEARKAGTLAPAVDKNGNMINPHMPEYMSKVPWYVKQEENAGLEFQRLKPEEKHSIHDFDKKGLFTHQAKKYRKGACENCGAMTHKTKDCTELPRRHKASYTNSNIMPDEYIAPKRNMTYAEKRDLYNGVDEEKIMQRAELVYKNADAQRRERDINELNSKFFTEPIEDGKRFFNMENKQVVNQNAINTLVDEKDMNKTKNQYVMEETCGGSLSSNVNSLRNLHDPAKYLLNLDPNSAYYDSKTRSMRSNPYENMDRLPDEVSFLGENYTRSQGPVQDFYKTLSFQQKANSQGININMVASPTATLMMQKEYEEKRRKLDDEHVNKIYEMYGMDKSQMNTLDNDLLLGETENYAEYDEDGNVIKGVAPTIPSSKYEEDVYPGNHKSIFGSWYDKVHHRWGYACCKQTEKNAYCMAN